MISLSRFGRAVAVLLSFLLPALSPAHASTIVTGMDFAEFSHVKVFTPPSPTATRSFFAYPPAFIGGVRVATGDVNGDGVADIITGAGPTAEPHVKVFDGSTGAEIRSFLAFDAGFQGGVFVAAGDINGDGRADIIVGSDASLSGTSRVKVFRGTDLALLADFFPFNTGFRDGARVAGGDVNGDGVDDIIVAAGSTSPLVKVFHGRTRTVLSSFFAYAPQFAGGVYVAAGDVNGDGHADIITGAGGGGSPHVKVFSGESGAQIRSFFAYEAGFSGGVRVASGDVTRDGRADIITAPGLGRSPQIKTYNGRSGALLQSFFAYGPNYTGGVFTGGVAVPLIRVTTDPATDVTVNSATLNGTVDPNGRTVSTRFEYGLTTRYGTTVVGEPPTVSGTTPTAVSAEITGLQPGKTYHYRLVVTDGLGGTAAGEDRTFTTIENTPPTGGSFVVTPPSPVPTGTVLTATFRDWTDEEGHTPFTYEVRKGSIVIVPRTPEESSDFTLPAGTHLLTGFIYDSLGAVTEVGPVEVIVEGDPESEALFVSRDPVPGAGSGGIPEDAKWTTFGVPALADGSVKFLAYYKSGATRGGGIFSDGTIVVAIGDPVPGAGAGDDFAIPADAVFKRFKDPVTSEGGHIAFIATIAGEGVRANNDTVVVSNGRTGALEVIAREGTAAPGAGGARYAAFQSVSIAGEAIAGTIFTARLSGARASENAGAWWLPAGHPSTILLVRKGDPGFAEGERIQNFALLQTWPGTPGHGRGQISADRALLQVKLSSGRQAQVLATPGMLEVIAATGDTFADGAVWLRMAQPSSDQSGQFLSVRGSFRPASAPPSSAAGTGIMTSLDGGATWSILAALGDVAPGTDAAWVQLGFPVTSRTEASFAFLGRVRGGTVRGINDTGVWWKPAGGELQLLAQEGTQAVGARVGETFLSFRSLAYQGGTTGPLILATLAGPTVTPANNLGVWTVDSSGSLRLIIRKGQKIGAKTVRSFTILSEVSGSPGVARAFNDLAQLTWRAIFTDGTSGIVVTQIP